MLLYLGMLVLVMRNGTTNNITDLKAIIHLIVVFMRYRAILLMTLCLITILELAAADLSRVRAQVPLLVAIPHWWPLMGSLSTLRREPWLLDFDRSISVDEDLIPRS